MKRVIIRIGLAIVLAALLGLTIFFWFIKIPDLKGKLSKSDVVYAELKETNEKCESGYMEADEKNKELENKIIEQQKTIEEKDKTINDKDAQIKKLNQEIETLKKN